MAWASLLEKEVSSCRNEDKFSEKKINHSKTLVSFSETLIYFSKTCSLADQIASLEAQLKTARLAQGAESTNAREILKSAARACESVDSTDEALASVGWALRKGRSPSQILPTPTRLSLRPSGFPGEMIARWSRVINFRYYELQVAVSEDNSSNPDWDLIPVRSTTSASDTLPRATIGKQMHLRVRTVSPKGPSPWSDAVVAIVL